MKIGDYVKSTKVRPESVAVITKVELYKTPTYIRTVYTARFEDFSTFIFYGSQVNKSVFKVMDNRDGQMSIFDFIDKEDSEGC